MNFRKKTGWMIYSMLLAGSLLFHMQLFAQQVRMPVRGLAVIARPGRDSILLRWAPATPLLWKMANQLGYTITRYTIMRNGKLLAVPEQFHVTQQPIKPLPLPAWEQVVIQHEQYGAIAAQGLYGESFEVSAPQHRSARDIMSIYHQSQELEARYSFTLLAADMSFEVARAAGLGYVDKLVLPDEKYLYRVYINGVTPGIKADTGFIFTGYADYQPVPAPHGVEAQPMKKAVMLSWDKTMFDHIFTAYIIERSENGGASFHALNEEPVINTSTETGTNPQQRFFRIDSVQTERLLVYRVRGITPFGELSPPSDTVHITVPEVLEARPSITGAAVLDGKVYLQWIMPAGKAHIAGFQVERAAAATKSYQVLAKQLLPPSDIAFTDLNPRPSNYYRLKAVTKDGRVAYSLPYFVQLEDSVPPAPPAGIKGVVNDSGIVRLQWEPNTEDDLYAYRVFRANDSTVEFTQITRAPLPVNQFTDTIEIKTLTRQVYYKVVALDRHYNPSAFSELFILQRPDVISPVPPTFIMQRSDPNGIYLQWKTSSSRDVARHELLRSADTGWQVLLSVNTPDSLHTFTDTSAVPGISYRYAVAAVDSSGLRSVSQPLTASRIIMGAASGSNVLKAVIDREKKCIVLRWPTGSNITRLWLYKAASDQAFRLYQTLTPGTSEFVDTALFINTTYRYKMKVFLGTSGESFFTDAIIVNY